MENMSKKYNILIVEDSKITGKLLFQNLKKSFSVKDRDIILDILEDVRENIIKENRY